MSPESPKDDEEAAPTVLSQASETSATGTTDLAATAPVDDASDGEQSPAAPDVDEVTDAERNTSVVSDLTSSSSESGTGHSITGVTPTEVAGSDIPEAAAATGAHLSMMMCSQG